MFEQDYIMRMIHQLIWALFKLLFDLDIDASGEDALALRDEDEKTLDRLMDMVDAGHVGEAEDIVFDIADAANPADVKLALLFFLRLNDRTDAFLEEHGFTREELADDLRTVLKKYGLDGMAGMLMSQDN